MTELKTFILHHLLPAVITYRENKLPFFQKILSEQFCLIFWEKEYYSDSSLKELYCDCSNFWTNIVWLFIIVRAIWFPYLIMAKKGLNILKH